MGPLFWRAVPEYAGLAGFDGGAADDARALPLYSGLLLLIAESLPSPADWISRSPLPDRARLNKRFLSRPLARMGSDAFLFWIFIMSFGWPALPRARISAYEPFVGALAGAAEAGEAAEDAAFGFEGAPALRGARDGSFEDAGAIAVPR